jgi:hypothetical protein
MELIKGKIREIEIQMSVLNERDELARERLVGILLGLQFALDALEEEEGYAY